MVEDLIEVFIGGSLVNIYVYFENKFCKFLEFV